MHYGYGRIPSSVESVVASSQPHLAASSLTRANQGTSLTRRFERHLGMMNVDETTEEINAIAQPEAPQQVGAAGAAPNMTSPPKVGSQRPRDDQQSPSDAPPRAFSRLSDDEVLDYESDGTAGAARASATQKALTEMMSAAATVAIPEISAAAKRKAATAASKAAKAEQRKAAAAQKKATPGVAGAAPQPATLHTRAAIPTGLQPVAEETPGAQQLPPGQLDPVSFPPLSVPMAPHLAPTREALDMASQNIRPTAVNPPPASTVTSAMPSRIMSPQMDQGTQVCKPAPLCPPCPRPSERAHTTARRCTLMLLPMTALIICYAGPVWRGGASRCNRGLGLSRGSPLKRHKSHGGSCLQAVPLNSADLMEFWNATAHRAAEIPRMWTRYSEHTQRWRDV